MQLATRHKSGSCRKWLWGSALPARFCSNSRWQRAPTCPNVPQTAQVLLVARVFLNVPQHVPHEPAQVLVIKGDERTNEYRECMANLSDYSQQHAIPLVGALHGCGAQRRSGCAEQGLIVIPVTCMNPAE